MSSNRLVIEEYEEILNGSREYDEATDNWTMSKAYQDNKAAGNARPDFNDVIWDEDIKAIANNCRRFGLKEFTISVRQGNLIDVLAAFQELGIFMKGIVQVNTRYKALNREGRNVVSAILMEVA